jgi:hypothetical protein
MCRKIDCKWARGKGERLQNVGLAPREPSPGELSSARSRGTKQSFFRCLVGNLGDQQARREASPGQLSITFTKCSLVVRTTVPPVKVGPPKVP